MRLLGIPVALFVIVAVPVLIAQQNPEPAPAEAKLTVRLTGDQGGKGHPFYFRVRAEGEQPSSTSKLVDSTGLKTASVSGDAADACSNEKTLETGTGDEPWCLKLSDVANGAEMSGVASGPGTKLTLTVTRRDAFVWGPLFVLGAGLVVAAIVALAPKGLRRLVRRVALARLLEKNREAASDKTVSGLDAWVAMQLASGAEPSAVFTAIAKVIQHGPAHAQQDRQSLRDELAGDPLGAGHPFAAGARAEANRTDHRASDFLDPTGKERTQHPAAEWLAGLKKMKANYKELNDAEREITEKIKPECQKAAMHALNIGRSAFARIKSLDAVTDLDGRLDTLSKTIDETLANPDCRLALADATDEEFEARNWLKGVGTQQIRGVPDETRLLQLDPAAFEKDAIFAVALTLASCLAVLVFAAVTVEEATYRDKHTFASFHDYFTLFSAALASGAAASVISLLAYWRPDPPAGTS
jgi:hypothetical protein